MFIVWLLTKSVEAREEESLFISYFFLFSGREWFYSGCSFLLILVNISNSGPNQDQLNYLVKYYDTINT